MIIASEAKRLSEKNRKKIENAIIPAFLKDIDNEITKAIKKGETSITYELNKDNVKYYKDIKYNISFLGYKVGKLKDHPVFSFKTFDISW